MDWVTSQVSQNTPFSLTITLPILSEQWYNLAYILFLYKVKLTNMDYSSCSVWLDMFFSLVDQPCWRGSLFGLILKPFFRPVKIGLRRTSPPSPPLCAALARGCTRRAFGARQALQGRSRSGGVCPPRKILKKMVQFGAIWHILSGVWWTNEVYKICFKNDWIMKIFFFIIVFLKNLIYNFLFYFLRFLGVTKFATICRRCIQCRDGKNKSSAVWSTHTYYIQIMTSHNYLALTWHTEI